MIDTKVRWFPESCMGSTCSPLITYVKDIRFIHKLFSASMNRIFFCSVMLKIVKFVPFEGNSLLSITTVLSCVCIDCPYIWLLWKDLSLTCPIQFLEFFKYKKLVINNILRDDFFLVSTRVFNNIYSSEIVINIIVLKTELWRESVGYNLESPMYDRDGSFI